MAAIENSTQLCSSIAAHILRRHSRRAAIENRTMGKAPFAKRFKQWKERGRGIVSIGLLCLHVVSFLYSGGYFKWFMNVTDETKLRCRGLFCIKLYSEIFVFFSPIKETH